MPCSNYIPPKIGVTMTSRDVFLPHLVCHVAREPLESLILQHQIKESPAQKKVFSLKNFQKISQTTIKDL